MDDFELKKLRIKLDDIDNRIISLISKRFDICEDIARYKFENNMEIFQPQREKELLELKAKIGKENNLDEHFVKGVFELYMKESKNRQKKIIEELKKDD